MVWWYHSFPKSLGEGTLAALELKGLGLWCTMSPKFERGQQSLHSSLLRISRLDCDPGEHGMVFSMCFYSQIWRQVAAFFLNCTHGLVVPGWGHLGTVAGDCI